MQAAEISDAILAGLPTVLPTLVVSASEVSAPVVQVRAQSVVSNSAVTAHAPVVARQLHSETASVTRRIPLRRQWIDYTGYVIPFSHVGLKLSWLDEQADLGLLSDEELYLEARELDGWIERHARAPKRVRERVR